MGHGLLILEVSRSHTTMHHSRQDSSGRVISSSQRPLPDNTQHSKQTNTHAPGGIWTHNLSRRAAVDLHLRPCGHWDWHCFPVTLCINWLIWSILGSFLWLFALNSTEIYTQSWTKGHPIYGPQLHRHKSRYLVGLNAMIWGLEQFMIKHPSSGIATSVSLREDIKQTMEL